MDEQAGSVAQPLPRHIHLVGIGGAHMSAIARLLLRDGINVSGCDQRPGDVTDALAAQGATVYAGHDPAHVQGAEMVVTTAAVRDDHPELLAAKARALPLLTRAQMVSRLMQGRRGVAVAGTHGKTTTSCLMAHVLHHAGRDPSYLLGGDAVNLGGNAGAGLGADVVVEADEYANAFLSYHPHLAIVTNIDRDHMDFFKTEASIVDAFRLFLMQIEASGVIIAGGDSPNVRLLAREARPAPLELYEVGSGQVPPAGVTWYAQDHGPNDVGGHRFTLLRDGTQFGAFDTCWPGRHNLANAVAVIAAGAHLGLSVDELAAGVRSFSGVGRRFEFRGEAAGVTVYDDYAHNPPKVQAAIAGARERFPGRRLVVLFQPHTYSRTRDLLDGFRTCFAAADALYVLETFAARESPDQGMSAEALVEQIFAPPAVYLPSHAAATAQLCRDLRSRDVLMTIGAGDVTTLGPAVLKRLGER